VSRYVKIARFIQSRGGPVHLADVVTLTNLGLSLKVTEVFLNTMVEEGDLSKSGRNYALTKEGVVKYSVPTVSSVLRDPLLTSTHNATHRSSDRPIPSLVDGKQVAWSSPKSLDYRDPDQELP
jgi:ribosomal protein L4